MKVILTNNQFELLKEALTARFVVSETRITFNSKKLNESYNDNVPPHQLLAMYLAGNKFYKYRLANEFDRNDKLTNKNPFNHVSSMGVSYYFKASFNVDGKNVNGIIRISDHPATPATFAKKGCDYGLSIVFSNGSMVSAGHNSVDAIVYEYMTNSKDVEMSELRNITSEFIKAGGLIEIENDNVIQPENIDFKKITTSSDKPESRNISMFTSWASKTSKFMSPLFNIEITATRDLKGNYHISDEDMKKFNYGDTITFFKIENGTQIELGKPFVIDK